MEQDIPDGPASLKTAWPRRADMELSLVNLGTFILQKTNPAQSLDLS